MSTHMPGFQYYFRFFLHHFLLAKLVTSSIRVKKKWTKFYKNENQINRNETADPGSTYLQEFESSEEICYVAAQRLERRVGLGHPHTRYLAF